MDNTFLRDKIQKPHIRVLALGGTISSVAQDQVAEFYKHSTINIQELLDLLPINHFVLPVIGEQYLQQISHEMTHEDLIGVAKRINDLASDDNVFGIVVSQGTNCIEEIAYFISLVVKTKKKIVFTGAFRPHCSLGYDGTRNLFNAILLASTKHIHNLGVVLTFNGAIVSARDAIKVDPSVQSDFSANGSSILGYIQGLTIHIERVPSNKHTCLSEFNLSEQIINPKIFIIYGHLGIDSSLIHAAVEMNPLGIISAGMGTGYQSKEVTAALIQASKKGIIIVRCSRSSQGFVNPEPGVDDSYGFIASGSLSPQKARILLCVALSKTKNRRVIQKIFDEY